MLEENIIHILRITGRYFADLVFGVNKCDARLADITQNNPKIFFDVLKDLNYFAAMNLHPN